MIKQKFTSGNEVVDRISKLNLHGNILPTEWFINIKGKNMNNVTFITPVCENIEKITTTNKQTQCSEYY